MNIMKLILLCSFFLTSSLWAKTYTTIQNLDGTEFTFHTMQEVSLSTSSDSLSIRGLPVEVTISKVDLKQLNLVKLYKLRKKIRDEMKKGGDKFVTDSGYVQRQIGRPRLLSYEIMYFYKSAQDKGRIIEHRHYLRCQKGGIYQLRYTVNKKQRFDIKLRVSLVRLIENFYCK